MTLRFLPAVAALLVALSVSGCFGLPAGSAGTGDLVSIRYTATDLLTGETLRMNRSASFGIGSGDSGLGLQLERAVRGHVQGDSFDVVVKDDPSLDYSEEVFLNRSLPSIPVHQNAPLAEFTEFVGEPYANRTFEAYGIYTGLVTAWDNDTVEFDIVAQDGQLDPVPSVGAFLESHVVGGQVTRTLNPDVGATFTIAPAGFGGSTLLGLDPGSYKVLGAAGSQIKLSFSTGDQDLVGRDLVVHVTVVAVSAQAEPVPTGGNYGVRESPQVNGDPHAALGQAPAGADAGSGHAH